jgi:hypothetical protein
MVFSHWQFINRDMISAMSAHHSRSGRRNGTSNLLVLAAPHFGCFPVVDTEISTPCVHIVRFAAGAALTAASPDAVGVDSGHSPNRRQVCGAIIISLWLRE